MKEVIKKCADCGKKFAATKKRKKLCPVCTERHKAITWEVRNEKARMERHIKKRKINEDRLLTEVKAADKLGVSYGKYKEMQLSGVVE